MLMQELDKLKKLWNPRVSSIWRARTTQPSFSALCIRIFHTTEYLIGNFKFVVRLF